MIRPIYYRYVLQDADFLSYPKRKRVLYSQKCAECYKDTSLLEFHNVP